MTEETLEDKPVSWISYALVAVIITIVVILIWHAYDYFTTAADIPDEEKTEKEIPGYNLRDAIDELETMQETALKNISTIM